MSATALTPTPQVAPTLTSLVEIVRAFTRDRTREIVHITILGGDGSMGQWICRRILEYFREHVRITITGIDHERGSRVAADMGVEYARDNVASVRDADVVVVSVPIDRTVPVIAEVGAHVPTGALLVDVTSIKTPAVEAMRQHAPQAEGIGTHPMWGPSTGSLQDQRMVFTSPTDDDIRLRTIRAWFERMGASVTETTPEHHDRMMSVVQGLTHFVLFAFAETLRREGIRPEEMGRFASPIYEMLIAMVGRYVGHDPRLYALIQASNPLNAAIEKTFIAVAGDFLQHVRGRDTGAFVGLVNACAEHFGAHNTSAGQAWTDRLITLSSRERQRLQDAVGQTVRIRCIRTGELREVGIIALTDDVFRDAAGTEYSVFAWTVERVGDAERLTYADRMLARTRVLFERRIGRDVVIEHIETGEARRIGVVRVDTETVTDADGHAYSLYEWTIA